MNTTDEPRSAPRATEDRRFAPPRATEARRSASLLRHPLLPDAEQRALALSYRRSQDPSLMQRLVLSNLRFVAKLASSYGRQRRLLLDLINEGVLGLMAALQHYDASRGTRLCSYSGLWVHGRLVAFLRANRSVVVRLRKKPGDHARQAIEPDVSLHDSQRRRMLVFLPDEQKGPLWEEALPIDYVSAQGPDPEEALAERQRQQLMAAVVRAVLATLSPREQYVLRVRYLSEESPSLGQVGAWLGLSAEGTRLLELRALSQMRRRLRRLQRAPGEWVLRALPQAPRYAAGPAAGGASAEGAARKPPPRTRSSW